MSPDALFRLWQLHQIDAAIVEIRARAAGLDPGREIQREIDRLSQLLAGAQERYHQLAGEQADLELKQKGIDEKIAKFEKDLFSGRIVNPREVEAMQREIEMLRRQRGEADVRILELWELVPPAKAESEALQRQIEEQQRLLAAHQKQVLQFKSQLEDAFKKRTAERPEAVSRVDPMLLTRYESIRKNHGGIGMTRVGKDQMCERCGTKVPLKGLELAKEGRLALCESCHRILYVSEAIA